MANVKISKKGKLLLKDTKVARWVSSAIAGNKKELSEKGYVVTVNGKRYRIRSISSLSAQEILALSTSEK